MVPEDPDIRIATLGDIGAILALRADSPTLRPLSDEEIRRNIGQFSIIETQERIVKGAFRILTPKNHSGILELGSVVVAPQYRGNGVAFKIVEFATRAANLLGKPILSVTDNPSLVKAYWLNGWIDGGSRFTVRLSESPGKTLWHHNPTSRINI